MGAVNGGGMGSQRGSTMFELVTVMAVVAIFAAVAVPGAARVRSGVSGAQGARRLALVLRAAQAESQSRFQRVRVHVSVGGTYTVTGADAGLLMSGELGPAVESTYPDGELEFSERGWAALPGSASPRAGHFALTGGASSSVVTIQLSGFVRCV
jgi:prepilin-type N-terminal cleavage/methylation domain-containing protein